MTRRSAPPLPDVSHLRHAVDAVLTSLSGGGVTRDTAARDAGLLRAGLAWTAATGDTCRIERAVRAVRDAIRHLTASAPDGQAAAAALGVARDLLKSPARLKAESARRVTPRPS
jgi:hypothetical protein